MGAAANWVGQFADKSDLGLLTSIVAYSAILETNYRFTTNKR